MAGNVVNIKVCSPLKLFSGLTGNHHTICHYSNNFQLLAIKTRETNMYCFLFLYVPYNISLLQ